MRLRFPRAVRGAPSLATALALVALAAPAAGAQDRLEQPWERRARPSLSVEGAGLYSAINAGGGGALGDGFGFDVQGNVGVSAFSLGVGYQRATQSIDGVSRRAVYDGVYLEPRLALPLGYGSFTPYLAGRVGRVRLTTPDAVSGGGTGTWIGGGGGVLVSVAPGVQLNLAGMWARVNLSDRDDVALDGRLVEGAGNGVLLRAGVVLGFDRWGR
jgi:hypothetical protein